MGWFDRVRGTRGGGRRWRGRTPDREAGRADLAIPVYDAQVTGYPQRMRAYDAWRRT